MLELARAAGIDVPRTRLIPITAVGNLPAEAARMGGQALAVERFDRAQAGRERIHMEDFAQVFGLYPEAKYKSVSYANIARVLWAEAGPDATYEFIRRIAFSVLIGKADMHLKSWSILYRDRRKATLSPAYDFVATLPDLPEDRLALTFGNARSLTEISADQIRAFVDRAGLLAPPVQRVIAETVDRVTEAWAQLAAKDLLPAALREPIARQIDEAATRTRPHVRKYASSAESMGELRLR
ncbi:MAG: HipA domain-containing protein [Acidobacteria bacterium]|nr:HipA domain-containing protein [Acidobacteriota bacterium]